ncbi:MAG: response regulator [Planctomycetota bacterium]|nr:response regulator [Planctomycetota bacterium]
MLTCRDVTTQKTAEETLRNLNASLDDRITQRTAEASDRTDQLRVLASELTRAEERERKRLAQLLHDHLQQLLVAAKLRVGIAQGKTGEAQDEVDLKEIHRLLTESIAASRSLTAELSPPILYDSGLTAALEWLARWGLEQHRITLELDVHADAEPASEDLRVFFYRAAREFLLNAAKHSGVQRLAMSLRTGHFGLTNIRERAVMLDGQLEIDSGPGRGTRVCLRIPAATREVIAPAQVFGAPAREPAASLLPAGPVRVLIADDHKIVRDGLRSVLARHDRVHIIGEAGDGVEALDMARRMRPDVVIMDASMPRMNGVEATRRLVAEMPTLRVLGLSMHHDPDMASAMRRAGAAAYLSKDGPSDQLLSAILGPGRGGD